MILGDPERPLPAARINTEALLLFDFFLDLLRDNYNLPSSQVLHRVLLCKKFSTEIGYNRLKTSPHDSGQ